MADDKKQKNDQKVAAGKKKALPPIVLIAVGAIVGGAGVVFAVPPKMIEVPQEPKVYRELELTHPDLITKEFNPRSRTGKSVTRVSFRFVYTVREDREHEALELLKANWAQANSNVLLILKTRSSEELQSEAGVRMLEHDLLQDLDRTFFPGEGEHKVASVIRVVWDYWLFQ